jgi:hypothetical protein
MGISQKWIYLAKEVSFNATKVTSIINYHVCISLHMIKQI